MSAWILAAVFVNFLEPAIAPESFTSLVENRSTVTISAQVLETSKPAKGFAGTEKFATKIRVLSSGPLQGRTGSLAGGEEVRDLLSGSSIKAVVSLRPAFKNDEDFSSNLKSLRSLSTSNDVDPLQQLRSSFTSSLSGVTSDSAALVAGLTIGDDWKLSSEALENLKVVSLTHLSAVSGTNCAIVLAGAAFLLNLLPIRRPIRLSLSFGVIFGYLGLVGPEPSVLRASVMVGAVLVGFILGRRVPPLEALSLAVVILLIYQPALAMDFGFALSALATLGLLVLAPKLVEVLAKRMPLWLAVVVSVSLAAQIACLPVLLMLQPTIPVYSIAANVIAEPLVAPVTVIGLIACLLSPVVPMVASWLSLIASVFTAFILFVAASFANAPSASISWIEGSTGIILAVVLVVGLWIFLATKSAALKSLAGGVSSLIVLSFFAQSSSLALQRNDFYGGNYSIVNCDVGQGDALVIRSKGKVAVVDVGREDPAIDSCLTNLGISKIDLLVLTHYDLDHVGGTLGAITGREVVTALVTSFSDDRPGADITQEILEAKGIPMVRSEKGMSGSLGDFQWLVLSPHRGAPEAQDSNDASTSMFWSNSQIALFTLADSGERAQLRIGAEYASLIESDFGSKLVVVKVAHHGSADQAPEFYEEIAADIALISVGQSNSYGHPTKRTLDLLARSGTKVMRTDEMGAIGLTETDAGLEVAIAGRS
ncbi:MAG: ComEC/Rec2 family competence protein [Rhodoluna sp.]|nr:ComEC/Rec2 family competence protein [Rhodoluna sp.]